MPYKTTICEIVTSYADVRNRIVRMIISVKNISDVKEVSEIMNNQIFVNMIIYLETLTIMKENA